MKIELYFFEKCPHCAKVISQIEKLDLSKSIIFNDIRKDLEHAEKHQSVTGRATVPCLYVDNRPMFESDEIISWLELNSEKIKSGS